MDDLGFADDRPIETHDQDLLGRSAFATNLAAAIAGWKNKESLVIALTGAWGSGKSSIKNLAIRQFAAPPGQQVIEYNPWEWTAQEKLSTSFFDEVSRAIQRNDKSKDGKKLAKVLRQYGRRINAGAELVDGLVQYLPLFLGSALLTSYLGTWATNPKVQSLMALLSGVSTLAALPGALKKIGKFLAARAESMDKSAKDAELTLSEIRREIRTLLAKREQPLLIVMDDIDRLSSEQMKSLFQLVKGNMDFPNVVFLLLFQRDIVEQGLERAGFRGAEYLEKIIQVPFSVPVMSTARLESLLFERLDAILTSEPQLADKFDRDHWHGMFNKGMRSFFSNLRDVYRYGSTLAFHCRLMRGTVVAEINAVDLFALECLRTFAPASYEALPRNKVVLTSSGVHGRRDDREKSRITTLIQGIVELAPPAYRSGVEQVIQQLFPALDWVFENTSYGNGTHARWLTESRVCRVEVFDRYFELAVPRDDVPNSLLQTMVGRVTDGEAFCATVLECNETQQREMLTRLESNVDQFPLEHSASVVETLLQTGEAVPGGNFSILTSSASVLVYRLLVFFLQRHDEPVVRSELLLSAFTRTKGFLMLERVLGAEVAKRRESQPGDLDDAGFERLKQVFVASLVEYADADPDAFITHWNFVSFAYRLNGYADGAGRRWILEEVTSVERFLLFAIAVISTGTASTGNSVSEFQFVQVSTLDALMGIETCENWVRRVERSELRGEAQRAIKLIEEALGRHQRGERSEFY